MSKQTLTHLQRELRAVLVEPGCPLCRLVARDEKTFLDMLTYERMIDIPTREALQKARGMCTRHAQDWRALKGSALPIALVYHVAVKDLLRDTESPPGRGVFRKPVTGAQVAAQLAPTGPCPVCVLGEETAARYGAVLLNDIKEPEVQAALAQAGGLCIPHLRFVLARAGLSGKGPELLEVHRRIWIALQGELEEFLRKNDYRFVDEPMGAERDSWLRALYLLAGVLAPEEK